VKNPKVVVPALILIIVIALVFIIARSTHQKTAVDEQGRDMLAPLQLEPGKQLPPPPSTATGGAPVLPSTPR